MKTALAQCDECGTEEHYGLCPECREILLADVSFVRALARGYRDPSGTVGAPGLLTDVLEIVDRVLTDVSSTLGGGSSTYQGRLQGISSRLNEGSQEGYILTVFFDSRTSQRLRENLSGFLGKNGTVAAGCFVTMVTAEPPTT